MERVLTGLYWQSAGTHPAQREAFSFGAINEIRTSWKGGIAVVQKIGARKESCMREQFINGIIKRQEGYLGASLDYLREIARLSLSAFLKIALLTPLVRHRRRLPKTAYHLAALVVTRQEDCGECVQIVINLAKRDGVPSHYLRTAFEGKFSDLPDGLAEVCEYARSVTQGIYNPDLAGRLKTLYGEEGLMELALAISTARVYPTLKRAMGYSQSCSLTPIAV